VLRERPVITPQVIGSLNPALVRYATRFMSRADAEDAVQDTWLSALRNGASVREPAALGAWLRTVLRRRMVDQRRKESRFGPLEVEPVGPADPEGTGRQDLAGAESHIASGMARLTPLERQAVFLVDVRGLDRDEASSTLKVSRGHLRVILHRGRQRLGKHLVRRGVSARLLETAHA
jgi:RNA polymerase sigma-70 factor (ECF subfamily)